MEKITKILVIISLFSISVLGQKADTKELLNSINGQWYLDKNNNVTYQDVIEIPELTKNEIYHKAESYFIYNYSSGKSVIQAKDKEAGLIIAKGLYNDVVATSEGVVAASFATWHIIKVEIKDGKARVTLSLTGYNEEVFSLGKTFYYDELPIANFFPINPDSKYKDSYSKAFYYSHLRALNTLLAIEEALRDVEASESDGW